MGNCAPIGFSFSYKKYIRFLFLGLSGSGKSTFINHIRLIFDVSFTQEERSMYRRQILRNIILGITEISHQVNFEDVNEYNRKFVRFFREYDESVSGELDPQVLDTALGLWKDEGFKQAWERCRKNVQIQFSQLDYFMLFLECYLDENYIPSDEDILRTRQRTTGAYTTRIQSDQTQYEMVDIGGQAPERKKWKSILDQGVNAIIYFAAMDEYNMVSSEDETKTKMETTMEIFKTIINDKQTGNVYLVLNKFDLFEEKILSEEGWDSFLEYFPDFEEKLDDDEFWENAHQACANIEADTEDTQNVLVATTYYLIQKFRDLNPNRSIIVLPSCALHSDIVASAFEVLKDLISS